MKLFFITLIFPVLALHAQSGLDVKITEAAKRISCAQPDESNPVTLNAQSVSEGDSIAVIVKVSMAPGWHIYAYVPATLPYIAIDQILSLPQDLKPVGDWQKTEPESSSDDPGVLIYEHEAIFIHKMVKLSKVKAGIIRAGLYYQTCNLRQCLPPKEDSVQLKY